MARKASAKVKALRAKHKKQKPHTHAPEPERAAAKTTPRPPALADDPRFAQAVENYQLGLKALQSRKFERAQALLEKVVTGPSKELADRAAVHLHICEQQQERVAASTFKSAEEHFDYAVSLINAGQYDDARAHFEKLQKQAPKADYVWYGMALLDCLTHKFEPALKNLERAIQLDPANRYRARNEADFQNLADDPRFTELLYPEAAGEAPPPRVPEPKPTRRR